MESKICTQNRVLHAARGSPGFHIIQHLFFQHDCGMFLYAIYGVDIFVDFYLWHEATSYSPECSYFSRHPEGLSFSGLRSEFLRHPEGLSF